MAGKQSNECLCKPQVSKNGSIWQHLVLPLLHLETMFPDPRFYCDLEVSKKAKCSKSVRFRHQTCFCASFLRWVCFWNMKNTSAEIMSFCEKGTAEILVFGDSCFATKRHLEKQCELQTCLSLGTRIAFVHAYCFDMLNELCRKNLSAEKNHAGPCCRIGLERSSCFSAETLNMLVSAPQNMCFFQQNKPREQC